MSCSWVRDFAALPQFAIVNLLMAHMGLTLLHLQICTNQDRQPTREKDKDGAFFLFPEGKKKNKKKSLPGAFAGLLKHTSL